MTRFFIKLPIIMMVALHTNSFAVVTAFMRGSHHHDKVMDGIKTKPFAAIVAGRQRHLMADVDTMKGIVHEFKLLAGHGRPRSASGLAGFDGNEQEMDDCVVMVVNANKTDVTNPEVVTFDTGEVISYFGVFDPDTKTGLGVYVDMPCYNTTINGYCEKSGAWSFFIDDDVTDTWTQCDGSRYVLEDGTEADQVIESGSGRYECANGGVIATDYQDLQEVSFELDFCMNLPGCV